MINGAFAFIFIIRFKTNECGLVSLVDDRRRRGAGGGGGGYHKYVCIVEYYPTSGVCVNTEFYIG